MSAKFGKRGTRVGRRCGGVLSTAKAGRGLSCQEQGSSSKGLQRGSGVAAGGRLVSFARFKCLSGAAVRSGRGAQARHDNRYYPVPTKPTATGGVRVPDECGGGGWPITSRIAPQSTSFGAKQALDVVGPFSPSHFNSEPPSRTPGKTAGRFVRPSQSDRPCRSFVGGHHTIPRWCRIKENPRPLSDGKIWCRCDVARTSRSHELRDAAGHSAIPTDSLAQALAHGVRVAAGRCCVARRLPCMSVRLVRRS